MAAPGGDQRRAMKSDRPSALVAACIFMTLGAGAPIGAIAQDPSSAVRRRDTVVVASSDYRAGSLHRKLLGDNYRDVWGTPIRVPFVDLESFAGGLRPLKEGGGMQTKSLRLAGRDGKEYVFRSVHKSRLVLPDEFKGTLVWTAFKDGLSAMQPAAPVMAAPIVEAGGILHPRPALAVMPDDSLLGEFRKDYAGLLGTLEEYPTIPDDAPGFGGAIEIIDSDELLKRLNSDPRQQVDARMLLRARLLDMLLNDNDRHPGQWKWARLATDTGRWQPIPRDRDKAFESYEGLLLVVARLVMPKLVTFDRTYPNLAALSANAIEMDRRLLAGLDKAVWDSVARGLVGAISDSVVEVSMNAMPREYHAVAPVLGEKMKARRDRIPQAADRYYRILFPVADIHGTAANEHVTVTRSTDDVVDVAIRAGSDTIFRRRFNGEETKEIRLYLHEGDDSALVVGNVRRSILVRIIGGNGTNTFVDSSTVGSRRQRTRLYDAGRVTDVRYQADTVDGEGYLPDTAFNRRPWWREYGKLVPPQRDRGVRLTPLAGMKLDRDLGAVPKFGFLRHRYGFRNNPYVSMLRVEGSYATRIRGWRLDLTGDQRFEGSRLHVVGQALVSHLEVVEFRGFGNDVPDLDGDFYNVRQQQSIVRPAVALSLGQATDVSLGPIVRYAVTDSVPDRFISQTLPYGSGHFGQAGVQVAFRRDTRDDKFNPRRGVLADVMATAYPAVWDARSAYQEITAVASAYFALPGSTRPVLAVRAGGKKLFGEFPYFDAAFIGGRRTMRTLDNQRYAGDASLYGSTELRIPVTRFSFGLPFNLGLLAFGDAGRVFVNGDSPGGWHNVTGAGFWLGVLNPVTSVSVMLTSQRDRRVLLATGVSF
jgi:hypothetical protein